MLFSPNNLSLYKCTKDEIPCSYVKKQNAKNQSRKQAVNRNPFNSI